MPGIVTHLDPILFARKLISDAQSPPGILHRQNSKTSPFGDCECGPMCHYRDLCRRLSSYRTSAYSVLTTFILAETGSPISYSRACVNSADEFISVVIYAYMTYAYEPIKRFFVGLVTRFQVASFAVVANNRHLRCLAHRKTVQCIVCV